HIRTLEAENKRGGERLTELAARLKALQATSATRDQEYEKLRQRLADAVAKLRQAESEAQWPAADTPPPPEPDPDLVRQLEAKALEIETLKTQLADAKNAAPAQIPVPTGGEDHAKLLSVIQAQKRTIDELNKRPPPPDRTGETGRVPAVDEVSALRGALRARDAEIALLREKIESATPQGPRAGTSDDLFASPPDGLLGAPDGAADDLKLINGIGPVLETRLNDLGVYHFRQIAGFSDDDIGWIASQINAFPNRILRDRWVEQAADLIAAS
ncbi:MAG: hypothetical protein AAFU65_08205, partial [Pseudomonadota bacterium]